MREAPVNFHTVRERAWVHEDHVWKFEPSLNYYFKGAGDSTQTPPGLLI